jgi:predicted GIY-YIG superfamily endonuclease
MENIVVEEPIESFVNPSITLGPLDDGRGPWYCYILRNRNPKYAHLSYNGSTNNPKRRLRQHNEEICGGARYTHGRGGGWEIYALLTGFPDHKNALSCEWRIKHTNGKPGKRPDKHCGTIGRIIGLNDVLKLDRWTKQCTIENKNIQMTLYLAEDVMQYINASELPGNVTLLAGIPIF